MVAPSKDRLSKKINEFLCVCYLFLFFSSKTEEDLEFLWQTVSCDNAILRERKSAKDEANVASPLPTCQK